MKHLMKFLIVGILLITLGGCCKFPEYNHTSTVEVTYTDGKTEELTMSYVSVAEKMTVVLDSETLCVIMEGSNGKHKVIACGVRKYEVKSLVSREIKKK